MNQESLAIYVDVLHVPGVGPAHLDAGPAPGTGPGGTARSVKPLSRTFTEITEGWRFIGTDPVVRAVMVGLGTGLIGGGMVVPLGPVSRSTCWTAAPPGFGLLLTALGFGVAVGVLGLSAAPEAPAPSSALPLAGASAPGRSCSRRRRCRASPSPWLFVGGMGVCAGAVYVLGFTILQENVEDELRGRIFATLYTLSRLCLLSRWPWRPCWPGSSTGCRTTSSAARSPWSAPRSPSRRAPDPVARGVIILVAGVLALRTLQSEPDQSEASKP